MTPRFYANGELIGFTCGIAGGATNSEEAQLSCPNSSIGYARSFAGCLPEVVLDPRAFEPPPPCGARRGNGATGGSTFGNPTIVANGARLERAADIAIGGEPALTFTRYYYGQAVGDGLMGVGWASDLDRTLGLSATGANPSEVTAQWPTGRRITFKRKGSNPNYYYAGDDDTEEALAQTATGWELRDREDRVESYDKAGWSRSVGATATSSGWSATGAGCWRWWIRSSARCASPIRATSSPPSPTRAAGSTATSTRRLAPLSPST